MEDLVSSSPSPFRGWYFEAYQRWNLILRILQERMHTQLLTLGGACYGGRSVGGEGGDGTGIGSS